MRAYLKKQIKLQSIDRNYKIINNLESSINLYKYKIFNLCIWPTLRQNILLSLEKSWSAKPSLKINDVFKKGGGKLKLFLSFLIINFRSLSSSVYLLAYNFIIKKKFDVVFLTASNAKRAKINELYTDVFCDPIIENLNKEERFLVLETSNDYKLKKPELYSTINIQFVIHTAQILSFILSIFLFPLLIRRVNDILYLVDDHFRRNKIKLIFDMINIKLLNLFFRIIARRFEINSAYINCYYGPQGTALCNVCHEENIKSVDIQHGVQGCYHYAYAKWVNIKNENHFPKEFWVWTHKDKEQIDSWSKDINITAAVTGNQFLQKFSSDVINKTLTDFVKSYEHKTIILYTFDKTPKIHKIVKSVLSNKSLFWFFRFHPNTLEHKKKRMINIFKNSENIDFRICNSSSIYELLYLSDFHITEMSSVVIESAFFSKVSIILSNLGAKYYEEYIKDQSAFFIKNQNELIKILHAE